jgi:translation initiation factor 2 beta subunit (eIF-2beta)/eIF-5
LKEKLYTIPVNEAFDEDSECPVCAMRKKLESNAIEFTMGPSYMEDDVREATSRLGFCEKHLEQLYKNQNRLGLALILKTHMVKLVRDIEKQSGISKVSAPSFFKKKGENSGVVTYINDIEDQCFVCEKIEGTFERYIATLFYLYHTEESFRQKLKESKGFCTSHYKKLYQSASEYLSGEEVNNFLKALNELYLDNMKRVRDDLEWFINKFDYRYTNEPWNNAKDALPRSMQKTNSITQVL